MEPGGVNKGVVRRCKGIKNSRKGVRRKPSFGEEKDISVFVSNEIEQGSRFVELRSDGRS